MATAGKKSKFDLDNAAMYLRLAFKAMSRDQDEALASLDTIVKVAGPDKIALIHGFAGLCAGGAVNLKCDPPRSDMP